MNKKLVKVVVAGETFDGPDLFFCIINCTEEEMNLGAHYDRAIEKAKLYRYEGPMVAFDEYDRPKPLFQLFEWDTASVLEINE